VSIPLAVANAASAAIATAPSHGTTTVSGTTVVYTPAAGFSGADSFTYTATGSSGTTAPATVTVTVAAPSIVLPATLASGVAGQPYTASVAATGGTAPYTYSVVGTLPPGLTLDTVTGAISGTPTASGDTTFQVAVTDSSTPAASATSASIVIHVYSASIAVTSSVSPGGLITVTGAGLQPGTYSVVLHSAPVVLGSVTVGAGGALSFSATVPSSTSVGSHTVQLLSGSTVIASASLTVTAAAVPAAPAPTAAAPAALASTGSDASGPASLATLLVLAGATALVLLRRRRAREA
jgi:LPXTG-motif cell wall-anchored protein